MSALRPPLTRLQRQWACVAAAGAACIAGAGSLLMNRFGLNVALGWGLPTTVGLAWFLVRLRKSLDLNHPPGDSKLRPSLGAANYLTIARAGLASSLAGFIVQAPSAVGGGAWAWLPGLFYLVASLLDYVDGCVARRTDSVTRLGEVLDTRVDALGLLLASLLLVTSAKAPLPYLWVGVGYYVLQAAIQLRRRRGRPVGRVVPRPDARWLAGCEMAFAALALLPVCTPEATRPAAWVMAAAMVVSLGLDWQIVCGRAAEDGSALAATQNLFWRRLGRGLPLALRITLAVGWVTAFYTPPENALDLAPWPLGRIAEMSAALCIVGVAARAAAMLLSVLCAFWLVSFLPGNAASVLLMVALALTLAGAGRPRVWQPEDRFLMSRRGASTSR